MGRRVKKDVSTFSAESWNLTSTKLFVYDGWNLIQELDGLNYNAVLKSYVWGLDLSQSLQGAGGVGGLLASTDGTDTFLYGYDANGNVGQMIDASDGSVEAHYEYDPFGNTVYDYGSLKDDNPFRFSTKYLDAETNLYYYGYRYYSPELGRWINRDPLDELSFRRFILSMLRKVKDYKFRERHSLSSYLFVYNNPLNRYDLFGLDEDSDSEGFSIDQAAVNAFAWALEQGCLFQCYFLGMPDEEIQKILDDLQNDMEGFAKEQFQQWLLNQPTKAGLLLVALLNEVRSDIKMVQGTGLRGTVLRKVLGDRVFLEVRRKIAQKTVRIVGKGGAKIFGRLGSKCIPVIGAGLLIFEGVDFCRCLHACKDDAYTQDETWKGLMTQ